MNKLLNLFRPMDEYIFSQIDQFKSSPQFQQLLGKLDGLSDNHQKILYQVISYFVILLPLIFVFIVFFGNVSVKSSIELREEIQNKITEYNKKKKFIQGLSQMMVSKTSILSKPDLQSMISNISETSDIDKSKISIDNFESFSSGSINKSTASLKFTGLSTKKITGLLEGLLLREKMKLQNIEIKKDEKDNVLNGVLEIIHFSKSSENGK